MSAVKTYVAGAALIGFVSSIPSLFLDTEPMPSAPITVHSLVIDPSAFVVTQDRTVDGTQGLVPMEWNARVESLDGTPVRDCAGSGRWDYQSGRAAFVMTVGEWVGHPRDCNADDLRQGVTYRLVASWWTVDGNTAPVSATSEPFTMPEVTE